MYNMHVSNSCAFLLRIYVAHTCIWLHFRFNVHSVEGAFGQLTYELIINGVQKEDYGTYTCKIKNKEGTSTKKIILKGESLSN